jgi:hypothetical protein
VGELFDPKTAAIHRFEGIPIEDRCLKPHSIRRENVRPDAEATAASRRRRVQFTE